MLRFVTTSLMATLLLSSTLFADTSPTTDQVWQNHIEAWSERDLDRIVADYDEESLLIINGEKYVGLADIRYVFTRLFEIFDHGENQIDPVIVQDRLVYITWSFAPTGLGPQYGTDTFLIEDGVIRYQTIASELYKVRPIGNPNRAN